MLVLLLSVITHGLQTGLYALINSIISSLATDLVLDKSKKVVAYYIICDKPKSVANAILTEYHRGVTRLDGTGMFTGNDKALLLCVVPYDQSYKMREFVLKIDPAAFVFSSPVSETIGENNFMKSPLIPKHVTEAISPNTKTAENPAAIDVQQNQEIVAEPSAENVNYTKQTETEIIQQPQDEKAHVAESTSTKAAPEKKKTTKKTTSKKQESKKKTAAKSSNTKSGVEKKATTKPKSQSTEKSEKKEETKKPTSRKKTSKSK